MLVVGRYVPTVMVMETGNARGAWYWKGFPIGTLVFERQKCAPEYKSSKEGFMVMCSGNASRNPKLKLNTD